MVIETTDVVAEFHLVFVTFESDGDLPDVPFGEVGSNSAGLVLNSSRPDHRPRIVINTEPGPPAGTPWVDSTPLFHQVMSVPGPTIRIHDGSFSHDVEFDWTETGSKQVQVYRAGDAILEEIDEPDLLDTVGVEQWLITLTDPGPS